MSETEEKEKKQATLPTSYKQVKGEVLPDTKIDSKEKAEEVFDRIMHSETAETKTETRKEYMVGHKETIEVPTGESVTQQKSETINAPVETTLTKPEEEWNPLNGEEDIGIEDEEDMSLEEELLEHGEITDETEETDENEPCVGCLEEATKKQRSWAQEEEESEINEEILVKELGEKQAEHQYRVAKDAKLINTQIFIARRLGELCHLMRKRLELDQAYYDLAQSKAGVKPQKTETKNPYETRGIYKDLEKYRTQLIMEERNNELQIRPRLYLGGDVWSKVTHIVQKYEGEWRSKGAGDKNAYWAVPL